MIKHSLTNLLTLIHKQENIAELDAQEIDDIKQHLSEKNYGAYESARGKVSFHSTQEPLTSLKLYCRNGDSPTAEIYIHYLKPNHYCVGILRYPLGTTMAQTQTLTKIGEQYYGSGTLYLFEAKKDNKNQFSLLPITI